MQTFEKDDFFPAGNFMVSIGHYSTTEVALFSKTSGNFVKLNKANLKRSKTLRKIKRKFRSYLNSKETFTFSHMIPEVTNDLIQTLKS